MSAIESPEDFAARLEDECGALGCVPEMVALIRARDAALADECERLRERVRVLEEALRPFEEQATGHNTAHYIATYTPDDTATLKKSG